MDIREVYSIAERFAKALVSHEDEMIASYLCPDLEESLRGNLGLPKGPHLRTQVLTVVALGDENNPLFTDHFASLTSVTGPREDIVVRAVWTQDSEQLLIETLQMFRRKPVIGEELDQTG